MTPSQVALQIYTLRDFIQSAKELAATLQQVRAIGYQAVEMIGIAKISPEEIRKIADGEGIRICSVHGPSQALLAQPDQVVDTLAPLGTDLIVYPFPGELDLSDSSTVTPFIEHLRKSSETIAKAGKRLAYHNHGMEFGRYRDKTVLEAILFSAPELHAELDTYWIQFGGGNPIAWIDKMRDRLPTIHLKDYGFNARENQPEMAELGNGNLDFGQIIEHATAAGCRWFIVEQDFCKRDPFESIRISFDYLTRVTRG
jgi:sugar phosphate isomerase/epimerase